MITLYLLGDTSQPMTLAAGLVIGHAWNVRDGKGSLYASFVEESKARETLARVKARYPNTAWTLKYDCNG